MNIRPTVSQWLGLALSVALLAAVLGVRQRGDLLRFAEDAELVRMRTERQRLSACEPAAVQTMHAAARALDERFATHRQWPTGWSADAVPSRAGSSQAFWRITTVEGPAWNGLIADVTALTSVPGNRIVSIVVRSRGTLAEREIASAEILLEQPTPTPSRRNLSGGTGSTGAEGSATPPAVGAGPSLRRPSASAEPPASVQASTPVRPDPRGPRAGTSFTQKTQPKQP